MSSKEVNHETRRSENYAGSKSPSLGWTGKMYLPLFVQGLTTTFKHLANRSAATR